MIPFLPPHFVTLYPQKSVSRNFQSFTAPYKFCLLAPLKERRKTLRERLASLAPLLVPAAPPCPVGSMSLDSRVAGLPYESSSFATPTSWGHYKAPLCCELLMKGLLFRALLSHRSAGGRWCRKAAKGGRATGGG